jgi:NADPH:quinone reductase-like Zn-dependent oxidoreductase
MDDLATIRKMIEKGNVTPRIDRIYPLEETAEALKYVAAGHARGKVVIKIAE